ncbi:MAG: LysM peptidoglycan-binding domain-containing protein [Lachnospiraceae bacterium]
MRTANIQKKKYRRERRRRTQQIIERCLLTVCLIALFAMIGCNMMSKATEPSEQEVFYKYYTQIEIQEGDSLWSIAGKYMENGSYETRKEYMDEVAELNQLTSTKIIAGQHLVVPYYDDTYK